MHSCLIQFITFGIAILVATHNAVGGVWEFTSFASWQTAVGDFHTIDFTDFPKFTFITDQYADVGVIFADGDDNIFVNNSFPPDMYGLDGNASITMIFTIPIQWIGVTYPGVMGFELYNNGVLVYTSGLFDDGGTPGAFAGLTSDSPFDQVVLSNTFPGVNIGDLYFGPPIPAPGAIGFIALAACAPVRRRRP